MKKTFEGRIHGPFHPPILSPDSGQIIGRTDRQIIERTDGQFPQDWDDRTSGNPWMDSIVLNAARNSDTPFSLVAHPKYCCCEYRRSLNVFTFGRFRWEIPFTVIALPVSIDECGFAGDTEALIADYKTRKGLFLMLNLHPGTILPPDAVYGATLPTSLFDNRSDASADHRAGTSGVRFKSFEEYLQALRSPARRRMNIARQKAAGLRWEEIDSRDFDEKLHRLYLNVLHHSKYPLETLDVGFFQTVQGRIQVLFEDKEPVAFVLLKQQKNILHFLFGGMDYTKRDEYDLYYNMLLRILEIGFTDRVGRMDFGQTAERSKGRIGCRLEPRGMAFFSGNKVIHLIVRLFSKALEYSPPKETHHIFKDCADKYS